MSLSKSHGEYRAETQEETGRSVEHGHVDHREAKSSPENKPCNTSFP